MDMDWVDLPPVSKDEIVGYGRIFDPQAQHVDEGVAAETIFGGLVMAGSQLTALAGRAALSLLTLRAKVRYVDAIENLRWLLPVRPDTRLRIRITNLTEATDLGRDDGAFRVTVVVELASGCRVAEMTLVIATDAVR